MEKGKYNILNFKLYYIIQGIYYRRGELSVKSFLAKKNNAAVIGLIATLIYIVYYIFAYLYSFDFFSYYSFDLEIKELGALLLLHINSIMLVVYFICVLCRLKNMKIIQYILLVSIFIACIKSSLVGIFPYADGYYLDILLYISYIGIFMYLINIFDIIQINFANNKFFITCIFINILTWAIYLFLAPEILLYFIFYLVAKISIIPFFYNEYNN